MNYPYSQINRLEEPYNYMYTPFQGTGLLQSYQSSRMAVAHRHATSEQGSVDSDHMFVTYALPALKTLFVATSLAGGTQFETLLGGSSAKMLGQRKVEDGNLDDFAKRLERLTMAEPVTTLDLLHALIAVQLTNAQDASTKVWLDRLVQRFEVTKKLYECYPSGFSKGEGTNTSVRLYWLFALALCLFYAKSNGIKYLSTLLKVCDLLCSLPENELQGHIPEHGLLVVLSTEIVSVQMLAEKKGVPFAPK